MFKDPVPSHVLTQSFTKVQIPAGISLSPVHVDPVSHSPNRDSRKKCVFAKLSAPGFRGGLKFLQRFSSAWGQHVFLSWEKQGKHE